MRKSFVRCLNCLCRIEITNGGWGGSMVTDGDVSIQKPVPGGMVVGNFVGHKCCDCWDKWDYLDDETEDIAC